MALKHVFFSWYFGFALSVPFHQRSIITFIRIQVKGKVTLEQATKAKRERRGIALPLL